MSFEAVPCMLKRRQEDGNEAQLFGLLIRTTAQTQQLPSTSSGAALSLATIAASPSSIQIVPNHPSAVLDRDCRNASRHSPFPIIPMPSKCPPGASGAMFAPNGMPPILPRPKQNGKAITPKLLKKTLVPMMAMRKGGGGGGRGIETVQSSSQVMSQFGATSVASGNCDVLSVVTSSPPSASCSSSSTPSSFPATHSPSSSSSSSSSSSASSSSSHQPNGLLVPVHSPPLPAPAPSSSKVHQPKDKGSEKPAKAPKKRKSKQREEEAEERVPEGKETTTTGEEGEGGGAGPGQGQGDLLGDLHSIDYSQLVNSTVITTEDYLISQSDPIYTNMDMYSPSMGSSAAQHPEREAVQQHQQSGAEDDGKGQHNVAHQLNNVAQQHFVAEQSQRLACPSSSGSASLCPSTIFLHNQQHQPPPSSSSSFLVHPPHPSSASSSVRFMANSSGGTGANTMVPQQWNPYMGAHPGGSHISSTPDSGIQSIDGSPPSVYTPPMVSPYSSQVRSCESVHNGGGGGGHGMFSSSSGTHPSTSSFYAQSYSADSSLLITAPISSAGPQAPPSLIIEQMTTEGENQGEKDPAADFSDMPKLVPVTHTEHDEEMEGEAGREGRREVEMTEEERRPNSGGGAREVLFHQGMSLHELAECLSSNISREQLKQLTSLIQLKAEQEKSLEARGDNNSNNNNNQDIDASTAPPQSGDEPAGSTFLGENREKQQKQQQQMVISAAEEEEELGKEEQQEVNTFSRGEEEEELRKEAEEDARERKKRRMEQLAVYRARVRDHLSRKLGELVERVVSRMEQCHLNIRQQEEGMKTKKGWPWPRMDWEEVKRRVEEERRIQRKRRGRKKKTEKKEDEEEGRKKKTKKEEDGRKEKTKKEEEGKADEKRMETMKKEEGKRGRKDAAHPKEEAKRGRKEDDQRAKEEEEEEVSGKKRIGRKRKKTGDEEERKEETKKHRGERSKERREEEEVEEKDQKQKTPPLILRIRAPTMPASTSALVTIKRATAERKHQRARQPLNHNNNVLSPGRRVPSTSPHPLASSSIRERSNSSKTDERRKGIEGRRWTTTTPSSTTTRTLSERRAAHRRQKRKWRMGAKPLGDEERAVARRGRCFLVRNLEGQRTRKVAERTRDCAPTTLAILLSRTFGEFCAILDNSPISHGQLEELNRAVKVLLFASASRNSSSLLDRFDSLLSEFIYSSVPTGTDKDSIRAQFVQLKQSIDFSGIQPPLAKNVLQTFMEESARPRASTLPSSSSSVKRDPAHRPLTVDTAIDLSYLDSAHPVGQWDPDRAAKLSPTSDNRDKDCVRCVCGMAEDDGVMSQCDRCHFWLHADCMDSPVPEEQKEFVCEFCARHLDTTPRVDIVLKPQPSIKLSGCTYFRTLVNSHGIQVRLNETVYVERLINDKHKSILRELHEECVRKQQVVGGSPVQSPLKRRDGSGGSGRGPGRRRMTMESKRREAEGKEAEGKADERRVPNRWWPEQDRDGGEQSSSASPAHFHRRDLRIFRVERLFISPNGQRFIFGCYYARPHETFCDSSRMFYRNELFWTPLFDTLPLDSVVGRCLILEPQIWASGRPKSPRYLEDDVYVCEYQIDRNQRSFEKIHPKNRYYINTEPYMFNEFAKKLEMRRTFTPFKVAGESGSNEMGTKSAWKTENALPTQICRRRILQEHIDAICEKIGKDPKGQNE